MLFSAIFPLINLVFILAISILGIYTLLLLIQALKIYIKNNS